MLLLATIPLSALVSILRLGHAFPAVIFLITPLHRRTAVIALSMPTAGAPAAAATAVCLGAIFRSRRRAVGCGDLVGLAVRVSHTAPRQTGQGHLFSCPGDKARART